MERKSNRIYLKNKLSVLSPAFRRLKVKEKLPKGRTQNIKSDFWDSF